MQQEANSNLGGSVQAQISLLSPVDSSPPNAGPEPTTSDTGQAAEARDLDPATEYHRPVDAPSTVSNAAYLGETRVLPVVVQEPLPRPAPTRKQSPTELNQHDLPCVELQESFIETYFEYCWPWCPVLDHGVLRSSIDASPSPLLLNALALLGCRIRPPLLEHSGAAEYYRQAKMLFYTDQEPNALLCLQSIALFYWYAPRRQDSL